MFSFFWQRPWTTMNKLLREAQRDRYPNILLKLIPISGSRLSFEKYYKNYNIKRIEL